MKNQLIATGRVESLCINGNMTDSIEFDYEGPRGDYHKGMLRNLSGHDGAYIRTSSLVKGHTVFNWRSWTGLSMEEIQEIELSIGHTIPPGCFLENIVLSGIPNFSKLLPTTRLVFPKEQISQLILAVWEENGPCKTVGQRLADHHGIPDLKTRLITEAQNKRGVMGLVLSAGLVYIGDEVRVYPPVQ